MKTKALLIDDEEWYYSPVLERFVDIENYEANQYVYVKDAFSALKKFSEETFTIIVIDIRISAGNLKVDPQDNSMPFGIYVLKKIRELDTKIPIVCLTIVKDENVQRTITALNAAYIYKLEERSLDKLFSYINKYLK